MSNEAHRAKLASEWTVSTTPMTRAQSEQAARMIEQQFPGVYADSVDPRAFLTVGFDRWTAEAIRADLQMVVDAGGDVGSMLGVIGRNAPDGSVAPRAVVPTTP